MFSEIKLSTPDPIMSLMEAYLQDRHPRKVNLGIGLYYDERGAIPLMGAVQQAEQRLLALQQPHGYPPIEGSARFASQIQTLLLGPGAAQHALATVQTVGGSGALKLAADLLVHFLQRKEIWVSDPTWANHQAIFPARGFRSTITPISTTRAANCALPRCWRPCRRCPPGRRCCYIRAAITRPAPT